MYWLIRTSITILINVPMIEMILSILLTYLWQTRNIKRIRKPTQRKKTERTRHTGKRDESQSAASVDQLGEVRIEKSMCRYNCSQNNTKSGKPLCYYIKREALLSNKFTKNSLEERSFLKTHPFITFEETDSYAVRYSISPIPRQLIHQFMVNSLRPDPLLNRV